MDNNSNGYKGKKVYIGIDVHKKTLSVTAVSGGKVVKKWTQENDQSKLVKTIKGSFKGAQVHSCYEAGFSGYGLHRYLESEGIKNIVINPANVEVASSDRVKTDSKDSKKLAEQLFFGIFKSIKVPSLEEEARREITRTRDQFVKLRANVANRIKSKLLYYGLIEPSNDRVLSKKYVQRIRAMGLAGDIQFSLDNLCDEWESMTEKLKRFDVRMKEQSFEDPEVEAVYESVPGVGRVSARVLSNELGDLSKRFRNQKSAYQYTGLCPSERSSGESKKKGRIHRQGSSRIRKILVECSWRAIKEDGALEEYYEKLKLRAGGKKAIIAVARKLMGRMRACFMYQESYAVGLVQ